MGRFLSENILLPAMYAMVDVVLIMVIILCFFTIIDKIKGKWR